MVYYGTATLVLVVIAIVGGNGDAVVSVAGFVGSGVVLIVVLVLSSSSS